MLALSENYDCHKKNTRGFNHVMIRISIRETQEKYNCQRTMIDNKVKTNTYRSTCIYIQIFPQITHKIVKIECGVDDSE